MLKILVFLVDWISGHIFSMDEKSLIIWKISTCLYAIFYLLSVSIITYRVFPFDFIYISCTKNDQLPPESSKTDNVTYKWPRAGGATMSRAQNGHIRNSNTRYNDNKIEPKNAQKKLKKISIEKFFSVKNFFSVENFFF